MPRIREFDVDDALAKIMSVFWEKGYEGTSLQDIESATGLKKQSLYRIYRSKRLMYLAALRHYEQTEIGVAWTILHKSGSVKEKFQRLFETIVRETKSANDRKGCFLCNSSLDQAVQSSEIDSLVQEMFSRVEQNFAQALDTSKKYQQDKKLKQLKTITILNYYFGLRVLLKGTFSEQQLLDSINHFTSDL